MKTRNSLVSNSSSTSFVVAVEPKYEKDCPCTVKISIDISQYTRNVLRTERDVEDYFRNELTEGGTLSQSQVDMRAKMIQAIRDGKIVMMGRLSTDSDPAEQVLCELGLSGVEAEVPMDILEGYPH